MIRVLRAAVIGLMAASAVAGRPLVDVVLVARHARLRGMDAEQRERGCRVVEGSQLPVRIGSLVAGLAARRAGPGLVTSLDSDDSAIPSNEFTGQENCRRRGQGHHDRHVEPDSR